MSKPIYIGITQDPPKIVSIGETIEGMEVVDISLDSDNVDEITSQLQSKFDELTRPEGNDINTDADQVSENDTSKTLDSEEFLSPEEKVVPQPSALALPALEEKEGQQQEVLALPAPENKEGQQPEVLALTTTPTDAVALTTRNPEIPSELQPYRGAGRKTKKHKITKRYKNKLMKRRKTKRTHM
ncbi:MAG: hypothetical protein ACO3UU_13130, partial [Minisyncoccia bacterium]